jgi:hypothetical protein
MRVWANTHQTVHANIPHYQTSWLCKSSTPTYSQCVDECLANEVSESHCMEQMVAPVPFAPVSSAQARVSKDYNQTRCTTDYSSNPKRH